MRNIVYDQLSAVSRFDERQPSFEVIAFCVQSLRQLEQWKCLFKLSSFRPFFMSSSELELLPEPGKHIQSVCRISSWNKRTAPNFETNFCIHGLALLTRSTTLFSIFLDNEFLSTEFISARLGRKQLPIAFPGDLGGIGAHRQLLSSSRCGWVSLRRFV